MSTRRVSHERLLRLGTELTDRDRAILQTLATLHLVSGRQLLRIHWPDATDADARACRRTLARLTRHRIIARLERRVGGLGRGSEAWTYALDVAGLRLVRDGSARAPRLPGRTMWTHALAASEAYTTLIESLRGTGRELEVWQGEPSSWRRFPGVHGGTELVKPDAFLRVSGPDYTDIFFLEIDTGSQSRPVIRRKLDAYRRYALTGLEQEREDVFPRVLFFTTEDTRVQTLVDLAGELPPALWSLFTARRLHDATAWRNIL